MIVLLKKDYPFEALLELAASRKWKQHDQDVLNVELETLLECKATKEEKFVNKIRELGYYAK